MLHYFRSNSLTLLYLKGKFKSNNVKNVYSKKIATKFPIDSSGLDEIDKAGIEYALRNFTHHYKRYRITDIYKANPPRP